MPYEEESPFGAAIGVAGGFLQGQQQAKQQALENARLQQQIAAQQAQTALDQRREASQEAYQQFDITDRTRARNIAEGKDPDHPDRLITSELPAALQVGVSPKASLQAQYDKNMKIAMFFMSRGFKEQAAPYLDAASQAAQQMNSEQTFKRDFTKALVIANITTNREMQAIGARGQVESGLLGQRLQGEAEIHQMPTYADQHPRPMSGYQQYEISSKIPYSQLQYANRQQASTDAWLSGSIRGMAAQNDAATKDGKEPPNPNMPGFTQGLGRMVDLVKHNPAKLQDYIHQVMTLPTLTESQKALTVEAMRRSASTATLYHTAQQSLNKANAVPTGGMYNLPPPALPPDQP